MTRVRTSAFDLHARDAAHTHSKCPPSALEHVAGARLVLATASAVWRTWGPEEPPAPERVGATLGHLHPHPHGPRPALGPLHFSLGLKVT